MLKRTSPLIAAAIMLTAGCAGQAPSGALGPAPAGGGTTAIAQTATPAQLAKDLTACAHGQARDANGVGWSFCVRAIRSDGAITHGQVLIASSVTNITYFGTLTRGKITRKATGGGTTDLVGTLTTGQTIRVQVTDTCDPATPDRVAFQVAQGLSFDGDVFNGEVRILRTRPEALGVLPQAGFSFDPRMGQYVLQADLNKEKPGPQQPLDRNLIELVYYDPIIDFRKNDPGGYVDTPGGANNVPILIR